MHKAYKHIIYATIVYVSNIVGLTLKIRLILFYFILDNNFVNCLKPVSLW